MEARAREKEESHCEKHVLSEKEESHCEKHVLSDDWQDLH
jgi:hypothetical protein